jgi:hypothetical protein
MPPDVQPGSSTAPLDLRRKPLSGAPVAPVASPNVSTPSPSVMPTDQEQLSAPGGRASKMQLGSVLPKAPPPVKSFEEEVKEINGKMVDRPAAGRVKQATVDAPFRLDREAMEPSPEQVQAIQKMSAADRQAFEKVAKTLQHDLYGTENLRDMAVDGRLTEPSLRNANGQTLLQALDKLASSPVKDPLNQNTLVGDVVREVFNPSTINQGNSGTCPATVVQIGLAREQPAEYARIIGGLASPSGVAKLTEHGDGPSNVLQRVAGTEKAEQTLVSAPGEPAEYKDDPRSNSSRLFQSAGMQLAKGNVGKVDVKEDGFRDPQGHLLGNGLTGKESATLSRAVGLTPDGHNVGSFDTAEFRVANDQATAAHTAFDRASVESQRAYSEYKAAMDAADAMAPGALGVAANTRIAATKQSYDAASSTCDQSMAAWKAATDNVATVIKDGGKYLAGAIERDIAQGHEVQVGMSWFGGGEHKVMVRRMDAREVVVDNPQGYHEMLSRADFEQRVNNATLTDPGK